LGLFSKAIQSLCGVKARATDQLAISDAVEAELRRVLRRRKFDRYVSREERDEFIGFVLAAAARFAPAVTVVDCRDPDDNM
jgi:predicted nucleic acid-binding protein